MSHQRTIALLIAVCGAAITAPPRASGQSALAAAWAFSEGTGASAADESGNGNTATLNGAVWSASGKFDAAVAFDGVDDRLDVADAASLDLSTALTLGAWVYADAAAAARTLVAKEDASAIVYGLFLTASSTLELRAHVGGTLRTLTSVTSIPASTWTHVAGTYDGSTLRVWINGLEENSLAATGSITASDGPLRIGGDTILDQPLAGRLDEVRIYGRAFSASELIADMDLPVDDVTPPTVSARSPAPSATGVAVGASITATFSEPIAASTVTSATFEVRDAQGTLVPITVSYVEATHTATLHPSAALGGDTTYTVTLQGGATMPVLTDLAGNPLAADVVWSFTTIDMAPPAVTGVTPAAATRNVSLATTVTVTFNEPIDPTTITTSTLEVRDTRNTLVAGSVTYDASTRTATFTPSSPLLPTRSYSATVVGGVAGVKDPAGNALAASHGWSFLTTVALTRVAAGATHAVAADDAGQVWTWGSDTFGERGTNLEPRLPGAVSQGTGIVAVAAGISHTMALKSDGTVLAWGWNNEGQVGNGTQTNQHVPVAVSGLSEVIAVAAGRTHSVALKSDGTVWVWGSGPQIGDGLNTRRLTPVAVPSLTDVVAVASGDDHTLALREDGTVWGWGFNAEGQLGDTTTISPRLSPVQVTGLSGIVGIAAGRRHSLAIVGADLSARAWGSNSHGQVGDGTTLNIRTSPVPVGTLMDLRALDGGSNRSVAVSLDGTVRAWGMQVVGSSGSATPVVVPGAPSLAQVATGDGVSTGGTDDGVVATWTHGGNNQGQAGDGTYLDRPQPITISAPGYWWKAGTPNFNLSSGAYFTAVTVQVTSATAAATIRYTTSGSDPTELDPAVPANGQLAIDRTTTVKARTFKAGQPGSNVATASYTLTVPPPTFSITSGTYNLPQTVVVTAIPDTVIRYTTNGDEPTEADPVVLNGGSVLVDVSRTLKAKAWHEGWTTSQTRMGSYTLTVGMPNVSLPTGSYSGTQTVTVSTVTPGAILRYTLSGVEPTTTDPQIASGATLTIDRSATLRVRGWKAGWTDSATRVAAYTLSLGTVAAPAAVPSGGAYAGPQAVTLSSTTPGAVIRYTDDASEPTLSSRRYTGPIPVAMHTVLKARAFSLDWTPSATITESYSVDPAAVQAPHATPGSGDYGARQVVTVTTVTADATIRYTLNGLDPTEADPVIASGATLAIEWSTRLKLKAWRPGLVPSAIRVADYSIVGAIAAGDRHTLALRTDGTVWSWGLNTSGELGSGATSASRAVPGQVVALSDIVAIAAGSHYSLAVRRDGTVWGWGANSAGQLGTGTFGGVRATPVQAAGLTDIIAVVAGEQHSLALRRDGVVFAWGGGGAALGLGAGASGTATPTQIPHLTGVTRLAAARGHSLALKSDGGAAGTVWTWGGAQFGKLGDAQTTASRPDPAPVLDQAIAVFAREHSSFAVLADGTARAWGANPSYRLGDGVLRDFSSTPVVMQRLANVAAVTAATSNAYALTGDGSIWAWGIDAGTGFPLLAANFILELPERVAVTGTEHVGLAAGLAHVVTAHRDGTVWTWGGNDVGQLGNGMLVSNPAPTPVPNFSLTDGDWLTDDPDGDGLPTWRELAAGTDPRVADTNGDGVLDGTALAAGISATAADVDGDGVPNAVETAQGTDPFRSDTDGEGVTDLDDAFPLDPSRSAAPAGNPADTTPPTIHLIYPATAVPIPPSEGR